ncbi:MAG: hypothetical protein MMC33_010010, partial [Icmadophila ericetorum]|nr:hypothetical protein [Icmadophila ericetorum]
HAAEAIKRRILKTGRYPFDKRKDINDLLWTWLKSITEEELLDNRKKLDKELLKEDRDYMVSFYVIKSSLNSQLALSESVRRLRDHITDVGLEHDRITNKEKNSAPRLLDPIAFSVLKNRITHYALTMLAPEWEATKKLGDAVEKGTEKEMEIDEDAEAETPRCRKGCDLPPRYGLPCRLWLYLAYMHEIAIPMSLLHPCWFLVGPPYLEQSWRMTFDPEASHYNSTVSDLGESPTQDHFAGDRFRNQGTNLVLESALKVVTMHNDPDGESAETYAKSFSTMSSRIMEQAKGLSERMPLSLPDPLREANVRQFPNSRRLKCGMTGREAAEADEKDREREQRKIAGQGKIRLRYEQSKALETVDRGSGASGPGKEIIPCTPCNVVDRIPETPPPIVGHESIDLCMPMVSPTLSIASRSTFQHIDDLVSDGFDDLEDLFPPSTRRSSRPLKKTKIVESQERQSANAQQRKEEREMKLQLQRKLSEQRPARRTGQERILNYVLNSWRTRE